MSSGNRLTLDRILEELFAGRSLGPELLADDAEWVNPPDAVDTERVIEDGDAIVALGALRGHIRGPGMAVEAQHGQIWTFRDGRVIRMQWCNTHEEALQLAGVRG